MNLNFTNRSRLMKKYYRCTNCKKFLGEINDKSKNEILLNGKISIHDEEIVVKCSCGEKLKINYKFK